MGANRLIQQGMAPAQIALLPKSQVILGKRLQLITTTKEPSKQTMAQHQQAGINKHSTKNKQPQTMSSEERIDQLLQAFAAFDNSRANKLVAEPVTSLSVEQVCRQFFGPLLIEMGHRWHQGELSIAAEHFGSSLIRAHLLCLLTETEVNPVAQTILCACPPEEFHEMGLLLFALEAANQGFHIVYLGPDVPVNELLQTARKLRPKFVALSFVSRPEPAKLHRFLVEVSTGLLGLSELLVGGSGLRGLTETVRKQGCLMMPESGHLADLSGTIEKHETQPNSNERAIPHKTKTRPKNRKK